MILAAFSLIITGIYATPGGDIRIRFETETTSVMVCRAMEKGILRTMADYRATNVRSNKCEPRRR